VHYDARTEQVTVKEDSAPKEPKVREEVNNLENSVEIMEKLECERCNSENVGGSLFH
jgi:hypothetical protein